MIAGVALVVGIGIGTIAGVSLAGKDSPGPAGPVQNVAPARASTPAAAKDQVCAALRADYPAVSRAIGEAEKVNKLSWSDPAVLQAVNNEVDSMTKLITSLETSLTESTPAELRAAVDDYIAGLRAVSISQRNHAPDLQANGTGLFYNQVVDAPLRICGIAP
ncbi:hypothetical protein [Mycobacteroides abscessus]|uniref:hypothetical protein n=1 Tax=Mycobacteroides abscessus TaxID=36809 RepID=UPI00105485DD|nr:hypothetical protein [Mycobacteroides abscessus]